MLVLLLICVPKSLRTDAIEQSITHADHVRIFADESTDCFWNATIVAEHVVQHTKLEVGVQRQTITAHALDDLSAALSVVSLTCGPAIEPAAQQFQTLLCRDAHGSHLLCAARQQRQYRPRSFFDVRALW
jgi:hypothetical protein